MGSVNHYSQRQSANFCPDSGLEFPDEVASIVWATKYAAAKHAGMDMSEMLSIKEDDLALIKKILQEQVDPYCMVCDSHREMDDFTDKIVAPADTAVVYNIDAHHDTYPYQEGKGLDCGNWLLHLLDRGVVDEAYWIAPGNEPYSPDASEMLDARVSRDMCLHDLQTVGPFDGVFLCRSGSWVPPHLDEQFLELAHMLVQSEGGWQCRLLVGILETRFNAAFLQSIQELLQFYPAKRRIAR